MLHAQLLAQNQPIETLPRKSYLVPRNRTPCLVNLSVNFSHNDVDGSDNGNQIRDQNSFCDLLQN
jgi:hypothetical protein